MYIDEYGSFCYQHNFNDKSFRRVFFMSDFRLISVVVAAKWLNCNWIIVCT